MAHSHSHSHGHHHGAGAKNEQRLALTLGLTSLFVVVEIAAGIFSGSLALLSDAAHMFSDVAGLTIALLAMKIGKRPANARKTYGYYRLEILASAFNAILLFLVARSAFGDPLARRQRAEPQYERRLSGSMERLSGFGGCDRRSAYHHGERLALGGFACCRSDRYLGVAAQLDAAGRKREYSSAGRAERHCRFGD